MYHSPPCVRALRGIHTTPVWSKKLKIPDPNVPKKPHIPTPKEAALQFRRRVEKAERDERMDLSMSLTEVKTYQGGFTKPRALRASNWFPGGEYIRKGKVYELPLESAYEPHTVFILETRYPVQTKEPGRPDVPEHLVNVVREKHFLPYVKYNNSTKVQGRTRLSMDAGWWPFLQRRVRKIDPEVWWEKDEDPNQLRLQALGFTDAEEPPEPLRQYYPDLTRYRNNGTKIVEETLPKTIHPHRKAKTIGEIRALYEPLLANEPFWRPLISVTLATRPLANTLVRLCRSLPRGLAFYASIENDDRKTFYSFPARMRLLRLQRMRQLTIEIARRLEGYQGGFIGIRFNRDDRGRAIRGERLAEPLPDPLRVIQVGVADWYEHEKEMELWRLEAEDAGVDIGLKAMDEWGRKLDASGAMLPGQDIAENAAYSDYQPEEDGFVDEDEDDGEDEDEDDDDDDDEDDEPESQAEEEHGDVAEEMPEQEVHTRSFGVQKASSAGA